MTPAARALAIRGALELAGVESTVEPGGLGRVAELAGAMGEHPLGLGCMAVSERFGERATDAAELGAPTTEVVLVRLAGSWYVSDGEELERQGLAGRELTTILPASIAGQTLRLLDLALEGDPRATRPTIKRVVTACCGVVEAATSYEFEPAGGGVAVRYRYWFLAHHGWPTVSPDEMLRRRLMRLADQLSRFRDQLD
jgi:hypothetical protein